MNDLEVIKQIERIFDCKIKQQKSISYDEVGYVIDKNNNVVALSLYDCEIKDLSYLVSFLMKLKNFKILYLDNNQITDISPLKSFINLTELSLFNNKITDATPVQHLNKLKELDLSQNQITDISALKNLTNLTKLHLYENKITDISTLINLTNLTLLNIGNNPINDTSSLQNLTKLTDLRLYNTEVSDISALRNLTNLTELYLFENKITDISPLQNLTNLKILYLSKNQISDISPLKNLTNLTELDLSLNKIIDISPLQNLTNLTELFLYNNQITDILPLKNLTNLTKLYLQNNNVSKLPYEVFYNLTKIENWNKVLKIKHLGKFLLFNITYLFYKQIVNDSHRISGNTSENKSFKKQRIITTEELLFDLIFIGNLIFYKISNGNGLIYDIAKSMVHSLEASFAFFLSLIFAISFYATIIYSYFSSKRKEGIQAEVVYFILFFYILFSFNFLGIFDFLCKNYSFGYEALFALILLALIFFTFKILLAIYESEENKSFNTSSFLSKIYFGIIVPNLVLFLYLIYYFGGNGKIGYILLFGYRFPYIFKDKVNLINLIILFITYSLYLTSYAPK